MILDGARASTQILPGANQECLGHVYSERTVGGGLLLGLQDSDSDGEPLL